MTEGLKLGWRGWGLEGSIPFTEKLGVDRTPALLSDLRCTFSPRFPTRTSGGILEAVFWLGSDPSSKKIEGKAGTDTDVCFLGGATEFLQLLRLSGASFGTSSNWFDGPISWHISA